MPPFCRNPSATPPRAPKLTAGDTYDEGVGVADSEPFWRALKAEVRKQGVPQRDLARRLHLSPSALSELLNGKRTSTPDWDVVRKLVEAIDGDVAYWRRRLAESEATEGAQDHNTGREPAGCAVCESAHTTRYDDVESNGLSAAARILAGRDVRLLDEMAALDRARLDEEPQLLDFRDRFDKVARRLLTGLRGKLRHACHVHKARLFSAARALLIAGVCVEGPLLYECLDLNTGGAGLIDASLDGELVPVSLSDADHHACAVQHFERVARELSPFSQPEDTGSTIALYKSRLAELAVQCPELFIWATVHDPGYAMDVLAHCPTGRARTELEQLYGELAARRTGLAGLETLLRVLARDAPPAEWPARIAEIHRHELTRPLSSAGEAGEAGEDHSGPRIPNLAQGYVNPAYRVAPHAPDNSPHVDAWWRTHPVHQDIQTLLTGHLTTYPTPDHPLIVLGDPGTGKSLLTKLIAARLPPTDYLPIRIELRTVPADASVLEQIDHALHRLTQRTITWAELTETSPGVLPVLIFDGFDELLQAGGTDHYRYLRDIADFQRRSATNGLPVAAIVTSRTVVADQAAIPPGSTIIRLEPFDEERIAHWTRIWNTVNKAHPCGTDLAARHPELAPQPLLLLMLALYHSIEPDAEAAGTMSRGTLYERLLKLFVRRQITKLEPGLRPTPLEEKVENELDLLSVIAMAMFNRGSQGVSATDAEHDLAYLRDPANSATDSAPWLLFGRFFFIHEARATYEDGEDHLWYEFLHATFGEYLAARKIARTLARCTDGGADGGAYGALLFALLSCAPLSDRAQIIEDVGDLLPETTTDVIPALFPRALYPVDHDSGYSTGPTPVTYRHACYSANLLLLAFAWWNTFLFSEIAGTTSDPAENWRTHATLWKSQFEPGAWDAFTQLVETAVFEHDIEVGPSEYAGPGFTAGCRTLFLHDPDIDNLLRPALPVWEELRGFAREGFEGHASYAGRALVALLVAPPAPHRDLPDLYGACLENLVNFGTETGTPRLHSAISRRLAGESGRLPAAFVNDALKKLAKPQTLEDETRIALLACACRQLTRPGADEPLARVIARLLGVSSVQLGFQIDFLTTPTTESAIEALYDTLQARRPRIWLLRTAIHLDLHAWCTRHAAHLLGDEELRDDLTPYEAEYLHLTPRPSDPTAQPPTPPPPPPPIPPASPAPHPPAPPQTPKPPESPHYEG
ncbi:helix-turn-helix domain-containing protein [Streptomyces sp. ST1015]|uniref:helix-turn-helix domain-containing protein n=1 Tax=unclassified Streptomyces TaxID=2593676 RepID=UPI001CA60E92|nr:helix-turn-helix domain-containing protein [Streptomyces sp. ST1015]QZZ26913.1 NACHT domain-containing protein [Streptomyces sp. ST1015]